MRCSETTGEYRATILIVEDQTAIRELLVRAISALPAFSIVGEARDIETALRIARERKPRVVLLDWLLPGGGGLDFLHGIAIDPPPGVLVFSACTSELVVREAMAAGARGYVEKTADFSELAEALNTVAAGRTYMSAVAMRALARSHADASIGRRSELSLREREVLRLLALGSSSKEIASRLGLSTRTIENHRASIMRRTGLRSVAQLTLHAVRLGLVDVGATHETG